MALKEKKLLIMKCQFRQMRRYSEEEKVEFKIK